DRVRHVGEAVAIVVAEDPYQLADGVERVKVAYEPLPGVFDPDRAVSPSAPRVHHEGADNLIAGSGAEVGAVGAAFTAADVVVEAHLTYPRVAGMPIEPRGILAALDPITGVLMVWTSTQVPFAVRSAIAAFLGLAETAVRVIVPEV